MNTTTLLCVLCGHEAQITDTDHGNRSYVACSDGACGDYEISKRAAREIASNTERKVALRQIAVQANAKGEVLEIVVGPDGQLRATSARRK